MTTILLSSGQAGALFVFIIIVGTLFLLYWEPLEVDKQRTDTEVKLFSYAEAEEMLKTGEWELCRRYEDSNYLFGFVYLQRKEPHKKQNVPF